MRSFRPSIRIVIGLCLGAVGLGASILAATLAGEIASTNSQRQAEGRVHRLAQTIRERLDDGLAEREREISVAASMLSVLSPLLEPGTSQDVRRAWLSKISASYPLYAWLGLADQQGQVVVAANGLLEGRSVAERDWFRAGLEGPVLGDVHEAKLLASLLPRERADEALRFVDVAAPIRTVEGKVAGVLGAHLHWRWAEQIGAAVLDDSPYTIDDLFYVLSRDGKILIEPRGQEASRPSAEALQAAVRSGSSEVVGAEGRRFLMGLSKPAGAQPALLGWTVVVLEDAEQVLRPVREMERQILTTGVVVGLSLAILGWLLGAVIAAPLEAIAAGARRIRETGGALNFVGGITAEIRSLADSLAELTGELDARQERLRQLNSTLEVRVSERTEALSATNRQLALREAELRAVFDSVEDSIVTIDARGTIVGCNASAERMFGISAKDLLGRDVSTLMPEPFRSAHGGYLARFFATGEAKIIGKGREVEGIRADGSVFPLDLSVSETSFGGERRFVGVMRDITQRRAAERAKSEFVSTVSHELRTPLTSIAGSLGLLVGGAVGPVPDKAMNLLGIARKNSERLVRLINDILDIEKIDSGKLEFKFQPVDLVELARQAVEQDRPFAEGLGVTLDLAPGPDRLMVNADPARIGQVIANLVSNAAKFSPQGGTVTVAVAHRAGSARLSVEDRGPGIPEAFRSRIFQRFAQADSSDTRRTGGTGLGLSISRGIVERHGGRLGFETETGRGTVFHVDLPLIPEAGQGNTTRPRILVCEDDVDIAEVLRLSLERDGFAVDTAHQGADALHLLASQRYAAMTLDINLPDRCGLDLAREIREMPNGASLPILVVSARDGAESGGAAVLDWFGKPVDMDRLVQTLRQAVQGRWSDLPEILHLEDDHDTVQLVRVALEGISRVTGARTLAEARGLLAERSFDLLLLDLDLPDGSGLEILPLTDREAPLPVVVFSAIDVGSSAARHVERVVTKSRTDIGELVATIRSVLDGQRTTRKETMDA
ncbi:ATP-binding protein [Arenibaculum pallidiluteum]|uniref:ATP-binding protein n=1 Tax=Arenibaculum pallidiluteum TaxID=2812559 RepID=UPI001A9586EB|nr:ATP-binding protein [Arenibaculum pallidiluteum]